MNTDLGLHHGPGPGQPKRNIASSTLHSDALSKSLAISKHMLGPKRELWNMHPKLYPYYSGFG